MPTVMIASEGTTLHESLHRALSEKGDAKERLAMETTTMNQALEEVRVELAQERTLRRESEKKLQETLVQGNAKCKELRDLLSQQKNSEEKLRHEKLQLETLCGVL